MSNVYRDSLVKLIDSLDKPNAVVVEVGVHRGRTTEQLLKMFPEITVFMVDPWAKWGERYSGREITQDMQDAFMAEALQRTDFAGNRRVICRKTSEEMAAESGMADLVFIDADHSQEAVQRDLRAWHPKVRPGGILCGHDYNGNHKGVMRAVDDFFAGEQFDVAEGSVWYYEVGEKTLDVVTDAGR